MKRVILMVTLILLLAIFCFYLSGHAIEVSPTKPLQPSNPSIQPSSNPPQIILMPDLIVERVWLDGQNRIAFLLRNIGNGLIPEDVHGRRIVRVTYRDGHKDYPLKVLDPNKALTRPGGMVSFTSDIKLDSTRKVTVKVDRIR